MTTDRHPGCDSGVHGVEIALPTCGHEAAKRRSPCPECGSRPALAIAMAYNEHPLDHARMQRKHILAAEIERLRARR